MKDAGTGIAVVVAARNARHLLWRSLAAVAAQTLPPAQVLVLDQGSTDGLADWLRLRWPGVVLCRVPAGLTPRAELDAALAAVAAPVVAFLRAGDRWPRDHLAGLVQARAENPEAGLLAAPATSLERAGDGSLRAVRRPAGDEPEPPLSSLGAVTARLLAAATAEPAVSLAAEIRGRLGPPLTASGQGVLMIAGAGEARAGIGDPWAWAGLLEEAVAGLPEGAALLVDLQAASRPAGMLNLLGMGVALGANGRPLQALTLADLTWDRLEAMPKTAPVVVTTPAALDLRHASDQLCLEELVRRVGPRPVRLVARALVPSSTTLLSRLIDMVQAQPGLELWVSDAVSFRYAVSLLGQARARLVPPPLLALAPGLREVSERRLLLPAMLGASAGVLTPGLDARFADPALWWQGLDPDAARRLAPALARVLGFWRAIRAPLLQQAWATALGGWAAVRAAADPVRTRCVDVALFAAMCARPALVEPGEAKVRDFLDGWAGVLPGLGVTVPEPSRAA